MIQCIISCGHGNCCNECLEHEVRIQWKCRREKAAHKYVRAIDGMSESENNIGWDAFEGFSPGSRIPSHFSYAPSTYVFDATLYE